MRAAALLVTVTVLLLPGGVPVMADPGLPSDVPGGATGGVAASQAAEPSRVYTYVIRTRGEVRADPERFAEIAASILGDAHGWTLGGSVRFRRVGSGGGFNLILASPQAVGAAHPVCSPQYSCRVGDDVLINDRNWREATSAWRGAGGELWRYRQYLINHEVGHYLGFGHFDCGGAGQPAPVMQQQSIRLSGCEPNGWPLSWERQRLADRLGVAIYDHWIFRDVLVGDVHRGDIHALHGAGIALGDASGYYRPHGDVRRDQMATFIARALDLPLDDRGDPPFHDVDPERAHADAVTAVADEGIAEGYGDGTYRPSGSVSRGQMTAFLARAYGLVADDPPPFGDVDAGHTHAESIAAVAEAGIAEGYGDGTFRPQQPVTRAQMAAFIARAEDL